ncbi:unnamed protein product [Ambrosiozyma monospora]|uniref:Unnamed protein product n=1 Tax=Ambrosiozyma monospora TaxID=43982 RepID=A0ACB5STB2_AMBMO|nr:unnamed protein product [Ambrosiozyma monospora]
MLLVYVDDGCCCGATQEIVDDVISKLSKRFMMKDLGAPSVFLGINIDKVSDGCHINMRESIEKFQIDYDITPPAELIDSPLSKGAKLFNSPTRPLTAEEHSLYRSLVGTILYLAKTVRVDVAYSVSLLSNFWLNPNWSI